MSLPVVEIINMNMVYYYLIMIALFYKINEINKYLMMRKNCD